MEKEHSKQKEHITKKEHSKPKKHTIKKDYSENPVTYTHEPQAPSTLQEPGAAYAAKQQGMYTIEDYFALPDDQRAELIDGVIYYLNAPTASHQFIAAAIISLLFSFVTSRNGKCLPFASPIAVQLDCDDKTMLQPDIILICDPNKIKKWGIYGAPDFVVEILSPSTRQKDKIIKLNKYLHASVREYWIIDPDSKTIQVFDLSLGNLPASYTFTDKVPVAVLNNELKIDFSEISRFMPNI